MNRRTSSEQGVAMVAAVLAIFVASILVTGMLYISLHNETATARNRSWGQAVHVAESGVQVAVAQLQNTSGVAPSGTVTGTTADGTYQYRVIALSRNRYQIDAVGNVGTDRSLKASRRVRAMLVPPKSFQYALFSLSDVTTKNNNLVCGDIWANTFVTVYQNDAVRSADSPQCPSGSAGSGSVNAATGSVTLQHNSVVEGDAWAGGSDSSGQAISLAGGASVGGLAKASSSTPGCSDDPGHLQYKLVNDGTISGASTAWGTISGSGIFSGSQSPMTCTAAPATKSIPPFSFNVANYPAGTVHQYTFPADYAAFNSYIASHQSNLSGVFYIQGGGSSTPVTLGGVSVGGDLTVVATDAPIDASQGIGSVAGDTTDKLVVLASFYAAPATSCSTNGGNPGDCAIGIKNNFSLGSSTTGGSNTAVVLYAPNGPVAFKNNADFLGAVYANNIQVKNNMNVIYDPRVSQIVGFGTVTLDIDSWLECTPGPVTTTSC